MPADVTNGPVRSLEDVALIYCVYIIECRPFKILISIGSFHLCGNLNGFLGLFVCFCIGLCVSVCHCVCEREIEK